MKKAIYTLMLLLRVTTMPTTTSISSSRITVNLHAFLVSTMGLYLNCAISSILRSLSHFSHCTSVFSLWTCG